MKNINLQAGLVAGGMLYLDILVVGLLVCGLMSFCFVRKTGGGS